jgi:2-polyprenyl-3-methyl-5-hydroxy-6-metoxy-1,4-benzoquinol methylase
VDLKVFNMEVKDRFAGDQSEWPAEDLERLGHCPVCKSIDRRVEHSELTDVVFGCAPGAWQLWRCVDCRSTYLDPRPTVESIHVAYDKYYTHAAPQIKAEYGALSTLRKLRRRLVNGFTNWRFSTRAAESTAIGIPLLFALRPLRVRLEHEYRHLPRNVPEAGRLLDVGCASGLFLLTAKSCGWRVTGVDPDPQSIRIAKSRGLDVSLGGLEHYEGQENIFDVVTICHVIEHVHDPRKTLLDIYRLLKPGGQIWIETPNIQSLGHLYFGRHWRGIETPRHLFLFTSRSLRAALRSIGFSRVTRRSAPSPLKGMFAASVAVQSKLPHGASVSLPLRDRMAYWAIALAQSVWPSKREFILLTAIKPIANAPEFRL